VTRCPSLSLAPSALVQLDSACALFSKAALGFKAEKVLVCSIVFFRGNDFDKSRCDAQEIMIKLREKAHASLQAFKDGRGSPLVRTIALSDDALMEDDELAMLGGRTRLVGKGFSPTQPPSPVLIQQSPTSHHPVIPCPLKQGIDEHMHPTVLDYLRTFGPTRSPQPPSHVPAAANRANCMLLTSPSLTDATAFFDIGTSYPSPPVSSTQSSAPQTPRPAPGLGLTDNTLDMSVFPTYFPVFDYGGTAGVGALCSPTHLDSQFPEEHYVRNTTPEATMQSSWQDFIAQFGLY
jgi:hypothetical protein